MQEEQFFTEKEKTALLQFKERLENLKLSKDLLEDRRLINWLRARDLRLDDAETMFRNHLKWRQEHNIDTILKSSHIPEDVIQTVPVDLVGVDKDGNPIMVVLGSCLELKKNILRFGKPMVLDAFRLNYENMYVHRIHKSTDMKVLKKLTYILDLKDVQYKEYTSPDVLDVLIKVMKELEANYPECLVTAYALNTPSFFLVLWNILKPFLAEKTISNVNICNNNLGSFRKILLEQIPENQLPRRYGGTGYSKKLPQLNRFSSSVPITDEFYKDFKEMVILAGDQFELPFQVENPPTLLSWRFKTTDYDIGFTLVYKPLSSAGVEKPELEYQRCNAQKNVQIGSLVCEAKGKYILRFDNTYSKLRGKTLMYHVEVSQMKLE